MPKRKRDAARQTQDASGTAAMTHRIANALRRLADWLEPNTLRCGHPRTSLYFSKYGLPEGECMDCGNEYLAFIREQQGNDVAWYDDGDPQAKIISSDFDERYYYAGAAIAEAIRNDGRVRAAIQDCVEGCHPGSVS